MASLTAQNVLDNNNYTTPDVTIGESLIDLSIDHINIVTGRRIAFMTGTAGTKTASLNTGEYSAVFMLSSLMFRAFNDKSPNVGIGGISVNLVLQDPQYALFSGLVNESIIRLRGRGILRTVT